MMIVSRSHATPGVACYYNLSCVNGTKASCPQDNGQLVQPIFGEEECDTYNNTQTYDIWVSAGGGTTKYCSEIGGVGVSVDPVPCS